MNGGKKILTAPAKAARTPSNGDSSALILSRDPVRNALRQGDDSSAVERVNISSSNGAEVRVK